MEKLKKSRTVTRIAFTRSLTLLNAALSGERSDVQELQVRFAMVNEKHVELEVINQKMLEVMIDGDASEEQLAQEIEAADDYRVKYHQAKTAVDNIWDRGQAIAVVQDAGQAMQAPRDNKRAYKLPKIEIPKFSGELKDWLQFWSLFKNIHEDPTITKEDKFQYLIQAMTKDSRASEVVSSFPPTAVNYDKVITSLKNRFGREDLLVEVYVREMLKLVLSKTKVNNYTPLSRIYDRLETQLRALESLGVTTDMCAAMLYPLVESSLPEDLLRVWQRNPKAIASTTSKQRLDELMIFLQAEVLSEERIAMAVDGFGLNDEQSTSQNKSKKKSKAESKEIATAAGLLSTKENKNPCIFCGQNHDSASCVKAKKMSREERCQVVKKKNACYHCLKTGHSYKFCRYKEKCAWCGKRHVLIMCRNVSSISPDDNQKEEPTDAQEQSSLASVLMNCEVFLQTLRIKLINKGKERVVRAVFDTGSHRSYVLDSYAKELGFEVVGEQQVVHMLFGGTKSKPQLHKGYRIAVQSLDNSYSCNFVALSQNIICQNVPSVNKGPWLQELQREGIRLTDVDSKDEPVVVLIGADIVGKLLTGKRKEIKCGAVAFESLLGWTLMGKTNIPSKPKEDSALMVVSMYTREAKVDDLWKLDTLGITDPIVKKTKDARQAEIKERFRQTIRLNEEERYEVSLPWKEDYSPLADNKNAAKRRLESTTKKLRDQGFYDNYQQIFDEWLSDGIIEKVSEEEITSDGYYLPHRHGFRVDGIYDKYDRVEEIGWQRVAAATPLP
ncbi:PREDICTED: uncharacterized protein LOC105462784 [Wasmannia auropunctata]|uniref:uncharacterized protein LOC105462784 n=1 Tax=Wasmannia auropunctata TaxID=64793 RepID=UPI0005EFCACB|nr:PREDICTED: uncharacterized protein LOC105462784 [Wasmannia auropunctata]